MTLKLPGTLHVAPVDQLFDDLAHALMKCAADAVRQRGAFHLALSGGSTPEPFYQRLIIDPRYRAVPWKETHIWIVDERRVPEDHEKSNWRMIRRVLTDHLPVKSRQLHPMPVLLADPATAYIEEMTRVFESLEAARSGASNPKSEIANPKSAFASPQSIPRLDFVLLGMGDDTHTASLFPGSPGLKETTRWIFNNDGPNVTPPPRVTMTYPLLNAARELGVLCVGAKKLATLQKVDKQLREKGPDVQNMPITGIQPTPGGDGRFTWWLDNAAAGVG